MALQPRPNRQFTSANLKRCPLCGAVNANKNSECFACGWYGRFDCDAETVEEGLNLLIDRCPELAENVRPAARPTLWDRIVNLFRGPRSSEA